MKSLVLLAVSLSACAHPRPVTPSYAVAASATVPHKGEKDACADYADAVAPRLREAGATDVRCVTYHWLRMDRTQGFHAAVAYTDTSGQWMCDNETPWPKRTPGATMQERCEWFARGFDGPVGVRIVSETR